MKTLLFLLLALTLLGSAPSPRPGGKDYALFIAVEQYDSSSAWGSLPGLIQECKDIRHDLITLYGFSEESKVLENPTLSDIKAELSAWRSRSYGPDDQLLIFFSGHGKFLEDFNEGYFIPRDGKPSSEKDAERDWYSLLQLPHHINNIPCRHILLAVDACYSGSIFKEERYKTETEPWETSKKAGEAAFNQHVHNLLAAQGRILMTSGGKVRTKHPSDLVKYFRQALADRGGKDGILRAQEFENYWPVGELRPMMGSFDGHEPGGNFLFVYQEGKSRKASDLIRENSQGATIFEDPMSSSMVEVKGGVFMMGNEDGDLTDGYVHKVEVSTFWISRYEVTISQYLDFCKATQIHWPVWLQPGSDFHLETGNSLFFNELGVSLDAPNMPIIGITYHDAVAYCEWLSYRTGKNYRLPTEAEWEFAARGGIHSESYQYAGGNKVEEVAWLSTNSDFKIHPVGGKKANELKLHDMSGNVWEMCSDWFDTRYFINSPEKDPKGPNSGGQKVIKGGSCMFIELYNRHGKRLPFAPVPRWKSMDVVGFRVAMDPK